MGAKNELEKGLKDLDQERISTYLSSKQCDFLMNVPEASHMGGVWERQIRTIRSVMNVVMAQVKGRLDDASLRTFFYEAMSIVNSRPLTTNTPEVATGLPVARLSSDACELAPLRIVLLCVFLTYFFYFFSLLF